MKPFKEAGSVTTPFLQFCEVCSIFAFVLMKKQKLRVSE